MKERPILFSAPMVRALLDGSKTQTRRLVKAKHLPWLEQSALNFLDGKWNQRPLPYGKPGDQLWVREAWRTLAGADDIAPRNLMNLEPYTHYEADGNPAGMGKLRPSMFMPRWASRITLEVTSVRVERLLEISDLDCIDEGIERMSSGFWKLYATKEASATCIPRASYRSLWESINGPNSWEANPWVWVISFIRVPQSVGSAF